MKTGKQPTPIPPVQPAKTTTTAAKPTAKPLKQYISIPGINAFKNRVKQAIANSIIGRTYRAAAKKIAVMTAAFVAKKVAFAAIWTGIKAAIAAAFGAATAGIVTAIWGAYEAAKHIPIVGGFVGLPEKIVIDVGIKAGIFVVACVVGLFILLLFAPFIFVSMYANPKTYNVQSDVSTKENTYSWNEFEKQFLSLDSNRHDDMKK